jgi:hypothetical protein
MKLMRRKKTKPVVIPVLERFFRVIEGQSTVSIHGKQAKVVFAVLAAAKHPLSITQLALRAGKAGLKTKTPLWRSVEHHMYGFVRAGLVEELNNDGIPIDKGL